MLKLINLNIKIKSQEKNLIENFNLEMESGKIYTLNGKNGSGKSSLLSAIMGHPNYEIVGGSMEIISATDPSKGRKIELNSVSSSVSSGIYMTMQQVPEIEGVTLIQLLHKALSKKSTDSKNECIGLGILDLNKKLLEYAERFNIDKSFITRDLNYKMSGGEKKQAELLHLLALKPQYVLIDEIDSGVDRESIEKIYQVIKFLQEEYGSSFLIVSHHTQVSDYVNVEGEYSL